MTSRGHLLILANDAIRRKAKLWIDKAPAGYRVRFQEAKRSTAQSDRMWAMIGDVARQKTHYGQKYNTETWKCLFMNSMGREVRFIPALDGDGVIPIGLRSSDLSVQEMSDLIAFIESWAVQNGVKLHDVAA